MKSAREAKFYIKYRLWSDIKHGEGGFGKIYAKIARHFNPVKPWFWRRNQPPAVELPEGYNKIAPCAYWTGDGWDLHWGAVCDEEGSTVWDRFFPSPLCDIIDDVDYNICEIYDWPFFLPYANTKDLERAGFYEV